MIIIYQTENINIFFVSGKATRYNKREVGGVNASYRAQITFVVRYKFAVKVSAITIT